MEADICLDVWYGVTGLGFAVGQTSWLEAAEMSF